MAQRLVEARGGTVMWVGTVDHPALHEGGDIEVGSAQVVVYPSRAAFIDMVTSAEYLKANIDRTNGLEKHVILATKTRLYTPLPQP